jgi:hypothetical protein
MGNYIGRCENLSSNASDAISTASGSERDPNRSPLATARGADPYAHFSTPYIDLQSDLVSSKVVLMTLQKTCKTL